MAIVGVMAPPIEGQDKKRHQNDDGRLRARKTVHLILGSRVSNRWQNIKFLLMLSDRPPRSNGVLE
ncbi:MAG: hypothetical protein JRC67_04055 [Deltaproteobacteria bacterium]|nr:hypothetical protein [Deltaproteobacteria bacterium]